MSIAPDQHLDIINPSYCKGDDGVFGRFRNLPVELRLIIWKLAAERNRLLEIEIQCLPNTEGSPPSCAASSSSHGTTCGSRYSITARGSQLYSKLLRVTRESREAALQFYQVHFSCLLQPSHKETRQPLVQTLLYLNLEYDFVRPFSNRSDAHLMMDFIHNLKIHDPRHVGLVNLAVDRNGLNNLLSLADTGDAHPQSILADTVSHLREVIWMVDSAAGRGILGPVQGFQSFFDSDGVGVRFNHSMPVRSTTPAFELFDQDPRAVGSELEFVATAAGNPRLVHICWQELLDRCKIRRDQQPRARVLFAYKALSNEQQVVDRKTAKQFLKNEEDRWFGWQRRWNRMVIKYAGRVPIEGPEELAQATRPAIGFWLFPAEAFGDVDGDMSTSKVVFDLRGHRPQLALSYLS